MSKSTENATSFNKLILEAKYRSREGFCNYPDKTEDSDSVIVAQAVKERFSIILSNNESRCLWSINSESSNSQWLDVISVDNVANSIINVIDDIGISHDDLITWNHDEKSAIK